MRTHLEAEMPPESEPERQIEDHVTQAVGGIAIHEGQASEEKAPEFTELSHEQILAQFIAQAEDLKIDIAKPKQSDREAVNKLAHTRVYEYHKAKQAFEFRNNIPNAEPAPLPQLAMRNRIKAFCEDPDTLLWATDKLHLKRLHAKHDRYERRYSQRYAEKMPEIAEVYALQKGLYDKGYIEAGFMLNDLLSVYGQAIKEVIVASAQARARKEQAIAQANADSERTYPDSK